MKRKEFSNGKHFPFQMNFSIEKMSTFKHLSSTLLLIIILIVIIKVDSFDRNGRNKYYGYPNRPILNYESDIKMHRGPNMDLRKKWLRNPVPYLFLEVVKQVIN